jgi:hypothetical protein
MADITLDHLRRAAFSKRVSNTGGNHIAWSSKDTARIWDRAMSAPEDMLHRDIRQLRLKTDTAASDVRRKFSDVIRAAKPDDHNFLFIISSKTVDRAGDVVMVDGIDCSDFGKNSVVLNSHNSSELPIATSTSPVASGNVLTAIAKFPPSGLSECSDQVAAAIRGGLVRASSIGFIPLRWSFSKDSSRPFGVDFHETKLLEWSVCSIPCNPDCLMIGAVDSKSAGSNPAKRIERWLEARAITAKARSTIASISDDAAPSREQRLAEARNFRRAAGGGK